MKAPHHQASPQLRLDVKERLLELLVANRLQKGRVNESDLARRIGVSRTPLREALVNLESEGFVQAADRGFCVPPLRALEIREIYPIIASLEVLALRSAGLPDNNQLKALSHLNDLYTRGRRNAREAVLLDTKFHDLLLSHCPNRRLIRLIHQHRLLLKRHELVFMKQDSFFAESGRQHDRIIAALRRSQLICACKLLEENWLAGMKLLLLRTEWRD